MATADKIRIGLIGFGYWGPNIARNLSDSDLFELEYIADESELQRSRASKKFPSTNIVATADRIINDPSIDAVAIVTPPESHFQLAKASLLAGKHVLIEKPVTTKSADALELAVVAKVDLDILVLGEQFANQLEHAQQRLVEGALLSGGLLGHGRKVRLNQGVELHLGL